MKQTCWIDDRGYWLRDDPREDTYRCTSSYQIDLSHHPIPEGLRHPRFIDGAWREGLPSGEILASSSLLVSPNWQSLKQGLSGFYAKYTAAALTANAAIYMSGVNVEVNSSMPSIDNLRFNLTELIKALVLRVDPVDKANLNKLLKDSGFDFQV